MKYWNFIIRQSYAEYNPPDLSDPQLRLFDLLISEDTAVDCT